MEVLFESDAEEARFVELMHHAMCRLDQARDYLDDGNPSGAVCLYYRVDTEIAARAYNMLPDDLKAKIEAGDEPPGK